MAAYSWLGTACSQNDALWNGGRRSLDQKILFGQLRTFHLFSHPDRKHPLPDHLRLGFFLLLYFSFAFARFPVRGTRITARTTPAAFEDT
jgi:hypothetical protein